MEHGKQLLLTNFHHFQDTIKNTFINERTPFYFISTTFLFITIVLSFISTFHLNENFSDFFPNKGTYYNKEIHDNTYVDKICWYFSFYIIFFPVIKSNLAVLGHGFTILTTIYKRSQRLGGTG